MADSYGLNFNNYNNEDNRDNMVKIRKSGWFAIFCGIIPFIFLILFLVTIVIFFESPKIMEIQLYFIQISNFIIKILIGIFQLLLIYIGLRRLVHHTQSGKKIFKLVLFFFMLNIVVGPLYFILLNNYSTAIFDQAINQELGLVGIVIPNLALLISDSFQLIILNPNLAVIYLLAVFAAFGSILTFSSLLFRLDGKYIANDLKGPAAIYLIQLITCFPIVASLSFQMVLAMLPVFFGVGCSIWIGFILLGVQLIRAH